MRSACLRWRVYIGHSSASRGRFLVSNGNVQTCLSRSQISSQVVQPERLSRHDTRHRQYVTPSWTSNSPGTFESTIYALSTAPGRAAIAVIRISGSACTAIYRSLCPSTKLPRARYAAVRSLYAPGQEPTSETLLDPSALVLYLPGPKTVTGEDILELHVHGGPAIVRAVLGAVPKCTNKPGLIRYAEAGEFTRRAFLNDRLDLTQVEALGDTLSATTEQQRRLSVRRTTNKLSNQYEAWRTQLLYARGELEALIDFSEDQHFDESPVELTSSVAKQVYILKHALEAHSKNAVRGELLRNGIAISLLGAPNAGKSSLLNRVVGREAAIVSREAGTTRDIVEVGIDLGGYLCRLGDTAGLRKAQELSGYEQGKIIEAAIGKIEQEGMRRAKERAAESDVVIVVLSFEQTDKGVYELKLDPEVITTAQTLAEDKSNVLVVVNKIDLKSSSMSIEQVISAVCNALPSVGKDAIHLVCCHAAETPGVETSGIPSFLVGLISRFEAMTRALTPSDQDDPDTSVWQESLGATERHRVLLDECILHLTSFLTEAGANGGDDNSEVDLVLAAEHLRSAAECLGKITGRGGGGDVEEVLGVVFEKFCVGK